MADQAEFTQALLSALEAKTEWFNSTELVKLKEDYRGLHTFVVTLLNIFIKKGVLRSDPYKLDKKISSITVPEETDFSEGDRATVIGMRLSDYESMLDFICNYVSFTIDSITTERIKKMVALNATFAWATLTNTSARPNTKGLAECIITIKNGTDTLTTGIVNDCVAHISQLSGKINAQLKTLHEYQREVYKGEIRKQILANPSFKPGTGTQNELAQIKKLFPSIMGKKPYYTELINEIVQENYAENKDSLQNELLKKLEVAHKKEKKIEQKIDPKEILLDSVRILGSLGPQLDQISGRIEENKQLLLDQHNTFSDRLARALRKMFNIAEKPVEYKLTIVENLTQTKRTEIIVYQDLFNDLIKRARLYTSFSVKKNTAYQKLETMNEASLLDYLSKQISECQSLFVTLTALDSFFKVNANDQNKSRMRGLKVELATMQNTLIKTNQRRAEYTALVEEQQQLKRLGITNA